MKTFRLIAFAIVGMLVCMNLESCSDDDNDVPPSTPTERMVPTKMEGGYIDIDWWNPGEPELNGIIFQNAKFDSQGRIVSYEDEYGNIVTFAYSQNSITQSTMSSYGATSNTYTLNDGKIVSDDYLKYGYNSANQLIRIEPHSNYGYNYEYVWNGSNMVKSTEIDGYEDSTFEFEYSSEANIIDAFYDTFYSTVVYGFDGIDHAFLQYCGFYGTNSKNRLTTIYSDGFFERKFEYLDLNEAGYPTLIRCTDDDGDIQEYHITWEKLK